jgi:hypothetical protein
MSKLDWEFNDDASAPEYVTEYRGLRIRAVHDPDASNPFEDGDAGHWPMVVRSGHIIHDYDKSISGSHIKAGPFGWFGDALLVHDQKAIFEALGTNYAEISEDGKRWCNDAVELRDIFESELGSYVERRQMLGVLAELYTLLGFPLLHTTKHGYVQSAWAEVLIVATPDAQKALRSQPPDMGDEDWAKALAEDMGNQADLYAAWAWGDTYGYVVEKPGPAACAQCGNTDNDGSDECVDCGGEFEEGEPEELDSCWSFYGSDFEKSGLEEAAIEAADGHFGHKLEAA